jgi:hypothetical protein
MDTRESYVYIHTCGLDLNWYAGRIRMMGGTGLALLINTGAALTLGSSWPITLALGAGAILAIWVATYRSQKFDEYIVRFTRFDGHLTTPSLGMEVFNVQVTKDSAIVPTGVQG